nr:MAG TPA: hypothetical protein [Caudoviricetes sp.]
MSVKYTNFSGLNTFSTPVELTDLAQQKPGKFKKKGCEYSSFLLISNCIIKLIGYVAGVINQKGVIKIA